MVEWTQAALRLDAQCCGALLSRLRWRAACDLLRGLCLTGFQPVP